MFDPRQSESGFRSRLIRRQRPSLRISLLTLITLCLGACSTPSLNPNDANADGDARNNQGNTGGALAGTAGDTSRLGGDALGGDALGGNALGGDALGGGSGGDGFGGGGAGGGMPVGPLSWHEHVAPIVKAKCATCHVQSGIAPFEIATYQDMIADLEGVVDAVVTRSMPPWPPATDCHPIKHSRSLSDIQIAIIEQWADDGAPEGDAALAPPDPPPAPGLSWVSATLDAGQDYLPNDSNGADDYRCFLLDPQLTADTDVIGVDFLPDVASIVHHLLLFDVDMATAQATDAADPGLGWTCYGAPTADNLAVVGGWAPGTPATEYPAGTGIRLAAGRGIAMQVHYNFDSAPAALDRTQVNLMYAASPVPKQALILGPVDYGFSIPPGAVGYTSSDSYPVFLNARAWGAYPHMHELGRSIRVEALGNGSPQCLIDIPEWDFHWQQFYFFDTPTGIPLTSTQDLKVSCTWDNPGASPVTWGESTTDEMCIGSLYLTF